MTSAMLGGLLGLLVLAAGLPAGAQPQAPRAPHEGMQPPRRMPMMPMMPEAEVGDPTAGKRLFQEKGCATCHAVKGRGGTVGPDLGRIEHTHNIYQMAGIMWNHAVHHEAKTEHGIKRPEFRGREMADILAYLHSLEVLGDPEKGKVVFGQKGCSQCHSVSGEGGKVGPPLVPSRHPHSPIELAGVMWNHSPTMTALMGALKIPRPVFEGNEMADLLAYLQEAQRLAGGESQKGAPAREPHHHHD